MISVVTIHLGDPEGLQRTLESLARTGLEEALEWVVIDGGSDLGAPGQAGLWERVQSRADKFLSEPDAGIYHAMNKGAALAVGDYVLFLNAGDSLHQEFDPARLATLLADPRPDMVWGVSWDRRTDGEAYPVRTRGPGWLRYGPACAHQAILFRRDSLGEQPYDTHYRIAADYDLICRIYRQGGRVQRVDLPVCVYELGGRSAQDTLATLREEARVRCVRFNQPGWLSGLIMHFKNALWVTTQRFPGLRKLLRRHL